MNLQLLYIHSLIQTIQVLKRFSLSFHTAKKHEFQFHFSSSLSLSLISFFVKEKHDYGRNKFYTSDCYLPLVLLLLTRLFLSLLLKRSWRIAKSKHIIVKKEISKYLVKRKRPLQCLNYHYCQHHPAKSKIKFCADLYPANGVLEVCYGERLWDSLGLGIRFQAIPSINSFVRSNSSMLYKYRNYHILSILITIQGFFVNLQVVAFTLQTNRKPIKSIIVKLLTH